MENIVSGRGKEKRRKAGKSMNMKKSARYTKGRGIYVLMVLAAIVAAGALYFFAPKKEEPLRTDSQGAVAQLSGIIQNHGVLAAQKFFLDNFFSYSDNNRHYLGHLIGEHVYKTYGLAGLPNCYSSIEFGCIHGFLLTGYMKEGRQFLVDVSEQCKKDLPEGCMHGLGHAYLLTRGYGVHDLRASLSECLDLAVTSGLKEQCVQGVYMEYNDRFLNGGTLSADSFVPRDFDPAHPLAPCDTEPPDLQPVCYRELVLYWGNISSINRETMTQYCRSIPNPSGRYECFWSFGGYVAGDDKVVEPSVAVCKELASDGLAPCIRGALMSAAFQSQKPRLSFCGQIPETLRRECETW